MSQPSCQGIQRKEAPGPQMEDVRLFGGSFWYTTSTHFSTLEKDSHCNFQTWKRSLFMYKHQERKICGNTQLLDQIRWEWLQEMQTLPRNSTRNCSEKVGSSYPANFDKGRNCDVHIDHARCRNLSCVWSALPFLLYIYILAYSMLWILLLPDVYTGNISYHCFLIIIVQTQIYGSYWKW